MVTLKDLEVGDTLIPANANAGYRGVVTNKVLGSEEVWVLWYTLEKGEPHRSNPFKYSYWETLNFYKKGPSSESEAEWE